LAGFATLVLVMLYQNGVLTPEKPAQVVSFIWFSFVGCMVTLAVGLACSRGQKGGVGN
jgi:hypothetical protein